MPSLADCLLVLQAACVAGLAVFALHRGRLVWLHLATRRSFGERDAIRRTASAPLARDPTTSTPEPVARELPCVTVQLPLYDEPAVAARLLHAVAGLDWPRDRLEVQVLDDSTDDTPRIVARTLPELPHDLAVVHLRRHARTGFKAGALAAGLEQARGNLVAIFDADFVPAPDFLRTLVPELDDPRVGAVQARWEHLDPEQSLLTSMQRLLLDGHFVIEHGARARTGRFFNFNGTAGILRRACIVDAGGWQGDTLTEDLDLSYRAQLRGWRFVYRPDVAVPAELPARMNDFLAQQHRWAKGAVQTAKKLLPSLLRATLPARTKTEACFHLAGNLGYVVLLALMLVSLPLQALRVWQETPVPGWVAAAESVPLTLSLLCILAHYAVPQVTLGRCGLRTWLRLPLVLALGTGMTVNAVAAVAAALHRDPGEFKRTPKAGGTRASWLGRNPRGVLPWLELALAAWCAGTSGLSWWLGQAWTGSFHALFAAGFFWVGAGSLRDELRAPRAARNRPAPTREPAAEHSTEHSTEATTSPTT